MLDPVSSGPPEGGEEGDQGQRPKELSTEFVISGEEFRNLLSGGFSARDSKIMGC